MSTGANCVFIEQKQGEWIYKLQCYPYGSNDDYDTFGPFTTFKQANKHLEDHHANPGGYSIHTTFPCKHDLITLHPNYEHMAKSCDRCGTSWASPRYEAKQNYQRAYWNIRNEKPDPAKIAILLKRANIYRELTTDLKELDTIVDDHTIKLLEAGKFRLDSGGRHSNAFAKTVNV